MTAPADKHRDAIAKVAVATRSSIRDYFNNIGFRVFLFGMRIISH